LRKEIIKRRQDSAIENRRLITESVLLDIPNNSFTDYLDAYRASSSDSVSTRSLSSLREKLNYEVKKKHSKMLDTKTVNEIYEKPSSYNSKSEYDLIWRQASMAKKINATSSTSSTNHSNSQLKKKDDVPVSSSSLKRPSIAQRKMKEVAVEKSISNKSPLNINFNNNFNNTKKHSLFPEIQLDNINVNLMKPNVSSNSIGLTAKATASTSSNTTDNNRKINRLLFNNNNDKNKNNKNTSNDNRNKNRFIDHSPISTNINKHFNNNSNNINNNNNPLSININNYYSNNNNNSNHNNNNNNINNNNNNNNIDNNYNNRPLNTNINKYYSSNNNNNNNNSINNNNNNNINNNNNSNTNNNITKNISNNYINDNNNKNIHNYKYSNDKNNNKYRYHPYQKIDFESSSSNHQLSDHPSINNQKPIPSHNPHQPPVSSESSKENKEYYSSREIFNFVKPYLKKRVNSRYITKDQYKKLTKDLTYYVIKRLGKEYNGEHKLNYEELKKDFMVEQLFTNKIIINFINYNLRKFLDYNKEHSKGKEVAHSSDSSSEK